MTHTFRPPRPLLAVTLAASCWLSTAPAFAAPEVVRTVKVAPGVYEIVHNPADNALYIASTGPRGANAASIVVLDAASLARKGALDVSAAPLYGLGLNEATQVLYGTATASGSVSAIDLKTGKVVATITHGEHPHVREAIVDPTTNTAYVSVVGTRDAPSALWVIDGATHALSDVIQVPMEMLTGIAVDPTRKVVYGTMMGAGKVVAVDLGSKQIAGTWDSGGEAPTNIVFDAAGSRLFVANQKSGTLTVLDAKSGQLLKSVETGAGALGVAFNPANQQIYVANRQAGTVSVVDAKTYAVRANLQTGTFPQTIAIDRKSNLVYVTNKARGLPRNAPPDAVAPDDPNGDTVAIIQP